MSDSRIVWGASYVFSQLILPAILIKVGVQIQFFVSIDSANLCKHNLLEEHRVAHRIQEEDDQAPKRTETWWLRKCGQQELMGQSLHNTTLRSNQL